MSRIRHLVSLPKTHYLPGTDFVGPSFSPQAALFYPASHDAVYSLFAPLHYTPGYHYPLIVWLHGRNSDERQLKRIMPLVDEEMRNYVAVAPRGVCCQEAGGGEQEGYGWPQAYEQIPAIEHGIFEAIDAARQKFNIHPERIFLAGFDTGGTMAFRVALSHPQYFGGILSLCGAFPSIRSPFANLTMARRLPILICVGRDTSLASDVCENLCLFHTAGMSVTLRQYPCGHELVPQMLGDINRWIQELIKHPQVAETADERHCETE
jgi:phospholipase/carboxylesterase